MRSRSANHVHKSWPQRFVVNVLDGRREVRALHTRSLALFLQRHRRLEKRIRSLEQALHRSRRVVNQLFVRFHADVPANTATSVRCSIRRSRARARRNRRLTSFSNRRRSSSSRIRGGLLEATAPQAAPQVAFRRVVSRPAAPQRPAALLDLLLLARRQLALDLEVPATPEDSATAVAAVLVTLSFASHQLSNHIPEESLRFSPPGLRCS